MGCAGFFLVLLQLERSPISVAALIPAAGRGERLGRGPKALLLLGDTTLLGYAVTAFEGYVDEVVVAVSADMWDEAQNQVGERGRLVEGGATRQATVRHLLNATDADSVLIHDAARPFLPRGVLEAVLSATVKHGAASVVRPVADTLIRAATGETVKRESLRAVQTPQGFERDLVLEAHKQAEKRSVSATDDAALVRLSGHPVELVEGSAWLMKVTTPADYEMAQALVEVWQAKVGKL